MYIDRIIVARLLETKPSKIRKIQQLEETIHIQLWSAKEPVDITIQQYRDFSEKLQTQHRKTNKGGTKRGIGIVLMIIGALIAMSGYSMDTTVSTGSGRVHNIGLINEQNKQIQLGGMAFIAGVILYCLDRKQDNS